MMLVLFFLVGAALAVGPWFVPQLGPSAQVTLTGAGLVVLIIVSIAAVITKLYRKASANMAFVRTGMGGVRVIRRMVAQSFCRWCTRSSRFPWRRCASTSKAAGRMRLITKDNLRVDLSAEFYIKVDANSDDILQAARSLGGRNVQPDAVSELVQEKLVSALRTVAATKELVELHAKRDEFASAVQEIVTHDLASNGLTLESVTISSLDQTDPSQLAGEKRLRCAGLAEDRRDHAEGPRRAEHHRAGSRAAGGRRKTSPRTKKVLDLQRDQAEFEAEQKMKVANVRAAREREVAEFKLSQDEAVAPARHRENEEH